MSTTLENSPQTPQPDDRHDEFTGAFGFFRKYQKLILYTAGIFALVTFSITGAVTQWLQGVTTGPTGPMPTISVGGKQVELQLEDNEIAGQLARRIPTLPPGVLPEFIVGKDSNDLATRLAILRRAAIECGIDVSLDEVDDAIDWLVRASNARNQASDTKTQLALQRGMSSLGQYRSLVKEAMRIGNFVLLMSMGVDVSDAASMQQLLEGEDREKIACRVATFDMKALEQELAAKGDITEDGIRSWMEEKSDAEKSRLEVFDTNRVSLLLGVLRHEAFDATQWTEELSGFEFGEQQKGVLYKQEIDRFKDDKGKPKPMDDAEVTAQLEKLAKADEVLNKLLAKLREEQQAVLTPLQQEQARNMQDKIQAEKTRNEAKAQSEAAPDDEELKGKLRAAEETFVAMENAAKNAENAVNDARKAFDFRGRFAELTKDKAGAEVVEVPGPTNAKGLKDLAAQGLGEWKTPERATSLRTAGELGAMPERAQNGSFLLQATEVVVRPMKAWDEIKDNLKDMYFREQAKKAADEKKQVLADELLRLGKEKAAEKVAELEQKQAAEVDKRYAEWEQKTTADLAEAEQQLTRLQAGTQAHRAWDMKRAGLQAQIDGKDKQRELFTTIVKNETDAELRKVAKERYGEVLDAAAEKAGFAVATVGPLRRDVRSRPFFNKRYDRTVVFLWGGIVNALEQGESTDIVEDTVERRYQIAVCDKVEPLTLADLSRKEFAQKKLSFALIEVSKALNQSYSMDALKARYDYREPEGRQLVTDKQ